MHSPTDDLLMTESQLLESLGSAVGSGIGLRDAKRRGEEIFQSCWNQISSTVCNSTKVRIAFEARFDDDRAIYTAIADVISGVLVGISPFTIAALIIKKGLPSLCETHWIKK